MIDTGENTVAILMAVHNGEKFIGDQIRSILDQTVTDWVLFIRDDGSEDDTLSVVREYASLTPRIVLMEDAYFTGGAKQNFEAIRRWVTEHYDFSYFMYCDQDDVWMQDKIEKTFRRMKETEDGKVPVLVHTDLSVVDEELNLIAKSCFRYRKMDPDVKDTGHILTENNVTGCTAMWNRSLNEKIPPDRGGAAMHDWWLALTASCFGKIECVKEPTVLYRKHGNNMLGVSPTVSLSTILKRLDGERIRNVNRSSAVQAAAFLEDAGEIPETKRQVIGKYLEVLQMDRFPRMWNMIRYGYQKQCLIHTAGALLFSEKIPSGPDSRRHIYLTGARSIGQYGGYESFVYELIRHGDLAETLSYHVTCLAGGSGGMDIGKLPGAVMTGKGEFSWQGVHGMLIGVPLAAGGFRTVLYTVKALEKVCGHIRKKRIKDPVVLLMGARLGLLQKVYVRRIHFLGGSVIQMADGHEDRREKWSYPLQRYLKHAERMAVSSADLVLCDSREIERYIREEYRKYQPLTAYIPFGTDGPEILSGAERDEFDRWLAAHLLREKQYYTVVGRLVPENNFETILREFMKCETDNDLVILTTNDRKRIGELEKKTGFRCDKRIHILPPVYDRRLLAAIRAGSLGYIHGHSVGGTNPSLVEAMGLNGICLVYDVPFNRETAGDTALYWTKEPGILSESLASLESSGDNRRAELAASSMERARKKYSWNSICREYEELFLRTGREEKTDDEEDEIHSDHCGSSHSPRYRIFHGKEECAGSGRHP